MGGGNMASAENMLLFLLRSYIFIRGFSISGGVLYSYDGFLKLLKPIGSVEDILFFNFELNVLNFFYEEFPIHFCGFKPQLLLNASRSKLRVDILKVCC